MKITKIHSMQWADEAKSVVCLTANTDTGNMQSIGTPYDTTSIIWDVISTFQINQIADYVALVENADV